jgi:hypothetical protein
MQTISRISKKLEPAIEKIFLHKIDWQTEIEDKVRNMRKEIKWWPEEIEKHDN